MVVIVKKLEEFDPSNSITTYVERAKLYLQCGRGQANSLFLSVIGSNISFLRNLLTPVLLKDKRFDEIVALLKALYEPKLGTLSFLPSGAERLCGLHNENYTEEVADGATA